MNVNGRKIWIGRWMVAVAIVHTAFGVAIGGKVLLKLIEHGVWNSVGEDPLSGMVVWFMLFGALLALLGMAVTSLERSAHFHGARSLGVGTAAMTLLSVILMPVSGFWLVFPPAIALMRRQN